MLLTASDFFLTGTSPLSYSDALTALHNSHDELLAQKDILEEKLQTDYGNESGYPLQLPTAD